MVINQDGTVVFDPGSGFEGTGTISGNTVTGGYPGSLLNRPGLNCTGSINVIATGAGTSFTGDIGPSTIVCNGVPFIIEGTFTVSKTSAALLQDTAAFTQLSDGVGRRLSK